MTTKDKVIIIGGAVVALTCIGYAFYFADHPLPLAPPSVLIGSRTISQASSRRIYRYAVYKPGVHSESDFSAALQDQTIRKVYGGAALRGIRST